MLTEQRRIESWRFTCLTEAGFDRESANILSQDLHLDLHYCCDLLKALKLAHHVDPVEMALEIIL